VSMGETPSGLPANSTNETAGQAGLLGLASLPNALLANLSSQACQAKGGAEIQLWLMFAARVAVAREIPTYPSPKLCSQRLTVRKSEALDGRLGRRRIEPPSGYVEEGR
jgi:hypothetical protein